MRKYIGAFLLFFVAQNASSWTQEMKCEFNEVDQRPPSISGVTWGSLTTVSADKYFGGNKSCRFAIKKGSEGWPSSGGALEWGSIFSFPQKVSIGQEVRLRFALFVPESFPVTSNTGALKFIRLKTRVADESKNTGCLDFLLGDPTKTLWDMLLKKDTRPPFIVNFEGAPGLTLVGQRPLHDVKKGVWETYEVYVKVDNIPLKRGGSGLIKLWKNNQLVVTMDDQVIVADSTGYMDALFLFTYWNGNAPEDAHLYMDDLLITTEVPANKDSSGFPFIGGDLKVNPPKSPLSPVYL